MKGTGNANLERHANNVLHSDVVHNRLVTHLNTSALYIEMYFYLQILIRSLVIHTLLYDVNSGLQAVENVFSVQEHRKSKTLPCKSKAEFA